MKINVTKLNAALAENKMSPRQVKSVGKSVIYRALNSGEITHKSLGLLADELGVKPIELLTSTEEE